MPVRKLRRFDETSGGVTLPKEDLRKAGVLEDDGSLVSDCYVKIEGDADEGEWTVRLLDA